MKPAQDSLEIEVKDFGPIVEAQVDLRPLTVFVGPSNTGKSYLAILIYALHRAFGVEAGGFSEWYRRYYADYTVPLGHAAEKLPEEAFEDLVEWVGETIASGMETRSRKEIFLPDFFADLLCSGFNEFGIYSWVSDEIRRCFGTAEIGRLIRNGSKAGARVVLRKPVSNGSALIEHELTIKASGVAFKMTIPEKTPLWIQGAAANKLIGDLRRMAEEISTVVQEDGRTDIEIQSTVREKAGVLAIELAELAVHQVIGLLRGPMFYLPADRTGVMHAHSVIVSTLIQSAAMAGLRPTPKAPMLSGILADFLQRLVELDDPLLLWRKPESGLAERIEETVLGGSVRVEKAETTGYPRFMYQPKGWKEDMPLMNASSMVSELAPVVLYLRHVVHPGNVLIVEEPESHLHPAKQVELIRQLAFAVRSGVRVIVTTHSEWILEELANIVRRSELPEARRNETTHGDFSLPHRDVGVWLFEPKRRPKGSVVKEIRLDDSDLYPSGFDDVAAALHNDWAEITDRIGDAE